MRKMEKV